MPSLPLNKKSFHIPEGVILADPDFEKPAEIDLLIRAEFFYQLLRSGQIRIKGQSALFQETYLGWIIVGRLSGRHVFSPSLSTTCNLITFQELPILWELGSDSPSNVRSEEELACEEHYKTNVQRDETGRYCVHASPIPNNEMIDHDYYLPHHAVVKTSSLTIKKESFSMALQRHQPTSR